MPKRWIWPLATTAVISAYFTLSTTVQLFVYITISLLATVLTFAGPGRTGDARGGWRAIGLGFALTTSGNMLWAWHEAIRQTPPFPSSADAAYLAAYLAFALGLLWLARAIGRADPGALLDATVVAIGAGVLSWVLFMSPYASDSSLGLVARIAAIMYPAGDLLLLTLLLRLLFTGARRRNPALTLLALSFAANLFANVGFAWVSLHETFATGHMLDAVWMAVYVLAGCAALHPSARTVTSDEPTVAAQLLPRWRLFLLAAASLVAPALVVDAGMQRAHLNLAVMGTASAVLFLLVLWRMAGLVRQISVQAAELEALSTTDPLTGVANRRRWDAELSTAVARAGRTLQPLAVALLDLDHFKAFNDTNGHPAGDALLSQVTAGWQAHLRPGDLLARIGGEEFAVLLIACDEEAARSTVERLRTAMPNGTTCSAGIAPLEPGDSPAALVARADSALYRAKETGRNRAVTASPTRHPVPVPATS